MKPVSILLLLAAPLAAQYASFASFTSVDDCGGQSAFMGSTYILEESSGFCGNSALPISTISRVGTTFQITLLGSVPSSSIATIQVGDKIFFNGTGPSPACLTSTAFTVASLAPLTVSSCGGRDTPSLGSPLLYVSYQKAGGSRYELRLLGQMGGSWSSAPTVTALTSPTVRKNLYGVAGTASCSFGNPAGFTDGTSYYFAFLAQKSTKCGNTITPGAGTLYDVWACNLTSTMPTPTLSRASCAIMLTVNPTISGTLGGASLDPHIWHNNHIYVSERDNSGVYSAVNALQGSTAAPYDVWSIDDITVAWGTKPTPGTIQRYVFSDQYWRVTGRNRVAMQCEEYYKLTGLLDMPALGSSIVRAFFQANDINPASSTSPFRDYQNATTASCETLGAGTWTNSSAFAGIFSADLKGSPYTTGVYQGDDYSQIYPAPAATAGPNSCLTPSPNYNPYCYGEFPWMFQDGGKMLFIGNSVTAASVVDACASVALNACKTQYTSDIIQAPVVTDFSDPSLPMALTASPTFSNYNVAGTPACAQLLSPTHAATDCGLLASPTPYFGGCGHLDINEASQYLTCAATESFSYSGYNGLIFRQTMVVPLAPTILNPGVQMIGPVQIYGGLVSNP